MTCRRRCGSDTPLRAIGLALFQTNREYDFLQSLAFAPGAGGGFVLALMMMSGIRERLELSDVNPIVQGTKVALLQGIRGDREVAAPY